MKANSHRSLLACGVISGLLLLTGCGGGSSHPGTRGTASARFPVTVQAANGPVVIHNRPTAILSLSPTATEMLYAVGAGRQVKAVDKFSDYPAGTPRTNLSELQLNVESVVALKPDLVLISNPDAKLTTQLKSLDIPVLLLPAASKINDVYAQINAIGAATGHQREAANENSSIRRKLTKLESSFTNRSTTKTYYYELDPTYYSETSTTFVGQLLATIGLRSIADTASDAAKSGGYPQLSSEFIVKSNPDFIVLADTICCHQTAASVGKRPGWSQITAIRAHHVIALNDDIASRWGPRIVQLLQIVANDVRTTTG